MERLWSVPHRAFFMERSSWNVYGAFLIERSSWSVHIKRFYEERSYRVFFFECSFSNVTSSSVLNLSIFLSSVPVER